MKLWLSWGRAFYRTAVGDQLETTRFVPLLLMMAFFIVHISALPVAQAEEFRHHEAHEHGVAHLNVAVEGNHLYIEFSSPAANIVGFEHHPTTEDQKEAISESIKKLKEGEMLFVLPPEAQGRLAESTVHTDIDKDSDHEHMTEDTHKHSKNHEEDKKHEGHHHEADEHEHERHSEFKAKYSFVCKKPKELAHVDVMLFKIFPGIDHIQVQVLTETKQTAQKLTAKNNKIVF
jgi:hypothetical protein